MFGSQINWVPRGCGKCQSLDLTDGVAINRQGSFLDFDVLVLSVEIEKPGLNCVKTQWTVAVSDCNHNHEVFGHRLGQLYE